MAGTYTFAIVNAIAYALNIILVNLSNLGVYGPDNTEQSAKYSTIITPAGWAFSIWGLIYLLEGIFTVYQLVPRVAKSTLISEGVNVWWVLSCIFQISWTVAFARDQILLAAVLLSFIWVSLVGLVASLARFRCGLVDETGSARKMCPVSYWAVCVPFTVHLGWVTAAAALNWNVYGVAEHTSAANQLAVAMGTLFFIGLVSSFYTFGLTYAEPAVSFVFAWATAAIRSELKDPNELVQKTFFTHRNLVFTSFRSSLHVIMFVFIAMGAYGTIRNTVLFLRRKQLLTRSEPLHPTAPAF